MRAISTTWYRAPAASLTARASPIPASASSSPPASPSARRVPPTCCASPISPARRNELQRPLFAVDLLERPLDAVHIGIDGKRIAEGGTRGCEVAELALDHAEPGERPEVTGLASQDLVDIGERFRVASHEKIDGGAPIPCFHEFGMDVDEPVKDFERRLVVAGS